MSIYKSVKNIKINRNKINLDFNIKDKNDQILFKMAFEYMKTRENGKRMWIDLNDGTKDYNISTETTYPSWISFYFEKTPKKERDFYQKWGEYGMKNIKPWENGYFNGNRKELLYTLENASKGKLPRSDRMLYVLNEIFNNFEIEFEEFENKKPTDLDLDLDLEKVNEEFNTAFEEDKKNLNINVFDEII